MKKFTYTFTVFIILNFALLIPKCFAQWEPDMRLTIDPAYSGTSNNNAWCIAANGNIIHVVWNDNRDTNYEIYYKRSTDGGYTWGSDTRLTNNVGFSEYPAITVTGSFVHVVWQDNRDGNNEIYYKRSTDNGTTWGIDTRLTNNSAASYYSSIAISGTNVHVVWQDNRDGNYEIYYKRSTDNGINWGTDTRLTNNSSSSDFPSIAITGTNVHIVWVDERDGNPEIYYKRSTDNGINWETDTRLTNNSAFSQNPSIATSENNVHVVWQDYRNNNMEIYYKLSTDNGTTWGTDTRLTNNSEDSRRPSIAISGINLHVVWQDNRDGNTEIYYKRSTDNGINWETDTRLTNNSESSFYPSIAISSSFVNVIWTDNRDGNYEIYYKHYKLIPTAPILISPANNSTGQPLNLNLVWNKPQYASKYRVLVATDSSFNNIIINDSLLTDSIKSISNLNPLTYYYWKVSAGNGNPAGWSSYSTVFKFKTIGTPTQVILFAPSNNAVNQPVNITFRWYKAFDQTFKENRAILYYWLEYSADSTFQTGVVKDSLITDSLKSVTGLNTATKYYWRVKAKNTAGWGNFSVVWNFTTVPPVPAAPVLISPPNNAVNIPLNVLLDWDAVQFAIGYRVQIANDSIFTNLVYDTSSVVQDTLRIRNGILINNTKYYWRVNATNISGTGPWSSVWNFTTGSSGITQTGNEIPTVFSLNQNYPNPFNPITNIKFGIPKSEHVILKIYNALGKEVATLVNERLQAGFYQVNFDASLLSSGVYYYRIVAGEFIDTKKMILIK